MQISASTQVLNLCTQTDHQSAPVHATDRPIRVQFAAHMLLTDPSECTLSHTPYGSTNQSLPCCLHATHQPIRVQLVPYMLLSTLTGFQMAVPMPGTHKRRKMTSKLAQMQNICKVPQTEHSASLLSTQRMVAHGDKQYFLKVAVLKC